MKYLKYVLVVVFFLAMTGMGVYFFTRNNSTKILQPQEVVIKGAYTSFVMETYDVIKDNYWAQVTDKQLCDLYASGIEKLGGNVYCQPETKADLEKLIDKNIEAIGESKKKEEFCANLANLVLTNLKPAGRSQLYSQKEETNLKDRVENRDPDIDLYKVLGVEKEASLAHLKENYDAKMKELAADNSNEAKQKIEVANRAYQVLSDTSSKNNYDKLGIEPTVIVKLARLQILHLKILKFSPTTYDELAAGLEKYDKERELNTLILDLRDNVGGSIDSLPYLLGSFIGNDQYAYQFLHQGDRMDFKSQGNWISGLVRYKKTVILVNENTQSTGELMAATLKKYNVGVLLGSTTRGWGTVERVFPLAHQIDNVNKYSIFLVHSLTLRDDNQPIEGQGVQPAINLKDANWEKQLNEYFNYPELVEAIKEITR